MGQRVCFFSRLPAGLGLFGSGCIISYNGFLVALELSSLYICLACRGIRLCVVMTIGD